MVCCSYANCNGHVFVGPRNEMAMGIGAGTAGQNSRAHSRVNFIAELRDSRAILTWKL